MVQRYCAPPTADAKLLYACLLGGVSAAVGGWYGALVAAALIVLVILASLVQRSGSDEPPQASRPREAGCSPDRQSIEAHPVSGLELRETLVERMSKDGAGCLGALSLDEHNRMTAIDPGLGTEVVRISAQRLQRMLQDGRVAAQVDRGQFALWFPGASEASVTAQMRAIAYSLGDVIEIAGQTITPQLTFHVTHVAAASPAAAGVSLARLLAALSLGHSDGGPARSVTAGTLRRAARGDDFRLEHDLRRAIANRQLALAYQPVVDAALRRVIGAEALLRWRHPDFGMIPPSRFVPLMESAGLAVEIGTWVIGQAVRQARIWSEGGLGPLRIAINASACQLDGDALPVLVSRALEQHCVSPAMLGIEITESLATTDAVHGRGVVNELRAMGLELSVDDFGTGYSGFSALRSLPFDKIKIDREFVSEVDRRRDSRAICQSIIALGRGLGMAVLAEGTERREEVEWLRGHGCKLFQGYYFSRPLDVAGFEAFVRDQAHLSGLLDAGSGSTPELREATA